MNIFSFIYLVACAIMCSRSDQNNYIVQGPDEVQKVFNVYWNVPTRDCKKHNVLFNDLFDKYGIIQNANDSFHGEKISILYHPGNFPGIVENISINGIVPQEGNLLVHLQKFKQDLEEAIPDKNFHGIGVIDFENWRPILRQNFGTMEPIRVLAPILEKMKHWWWPKQLIDKEAQRRFESSARVFLQTSLNLSKKLHPKALWGYYGFPECFNRLYREPEKCPPEIPHENDKLAWLWSESTVLFPSVYSSEAETTPELLAKFISTRIKEAARVRTKGTPILPYFWFRYRDGKNFKQNDLEAALSTFYNSDASGFIIWGSYRDVINKSLCLQLKEYVTKILGPAIAEYTKPLLVNANNIIIKTENKTQLDSKHNLELSETDNLFIEHVVIEELKRQKKTKHYAKGSELVDVILEKIAGYCVNNSLHNHISSESPIVFTTKTFNNLSFEITTPTTATLITEDTYPGAVRASDLSNCSPIIKTPIANYSRSNGVIIQGTNEKYYRAMKKGDISTFCQH